ncbi:heparan sulfate 2-O-sulfotransferase 1 isoform X1 [Silurus meridionalis]|nr:heparan sulfate 2-O-sulfotransferase 1 isoform X1 [Silurus meridionalis]
MPPKFQLLALMLFALAMLFIENQIRKLEESRGKLGTSGAREVKGPDPSSINSINFFSNLSYRSSSVGSDNTGQPLFPTCINEPWLPMIPFTPVPPHKCCSFGDALTQSSSHHSLALACPFFLLLTHQL